MMKWSLHNIISMGAIWSQYPPDAAKCSLTAKGRLRMVSARFQSERDWVAVPTGLGQVQPYKEWKVEGGQCDCPIFQDDEIVSITYFLVTRHMRLSSF
jgi:hypothetical protein